MKPLNELGAAEAAAAVAAGRITAEALVRACLERISAREGVVGAWHHLDRERALAATRRCDAGDRKGPLAGVPIGVKDIIDTVDMPTGYGSPIYEGARPGWDAACVALVKAAGGIVLGKTVTTEFAYFTPGKTANPHNPGHTPGGSSSGSAAAVADNMVPVAFATQTAGSVIRPASFCGVVGYKPSFDAFPLAGVKPFSPSLDTLGVLTRTVTDAILMRQVLLAAPVDVPPLETPPRIGLCRTPWWDAASADSRRAVERTADRLAAAGARVAEWRLPDDFEALVETQKLVMAFEAARALAYERLEHRERLSPPLRELIETGLATSVAAYGAALARAAQARIRLAGVFERCDALLAPSAIGEAPSGLAATGDPLFNRIWTLLHVPCVSLPGNTGSTGLPVGVQLIGGWQEDDRLLAIARWAEGRLG